MVRRDGALISGPNGGPGSRGSVCTRRIWRQEAPPSTETQGAIMPARLKRWSGRLVREIGKRRDQKAGLSLTTP